MPQSILHYVLSCADEHKQTESVKVFINIYDNTMHRIIRVPCYNAHQLYSLIRMVRGDVGLKRFMNGLILIQTVGKLRCVRAKVPYT